MKKMINRFENIDYWVCYFKHKMYNCFRETGREVHGNEKVSSKSKSSKSYYVKTSSSSMSSRSIKTKEIKEKDKLTELQAKNGIHQATKQRTK